MRGFFLLLLLTNVAFVGWQYFLQDTEQKVDPYRGINFEKQGLTLLSELPSDKRPPLREGSNGKRAEQPAAPEATTANGEVEVEKVAENTPKQVMACFKVGNLEERDDVEKLIAGLKKIGATSLQQGGEQGQDTNYWVMLPSYKNRKQAAEAAAILQEKKLKDFFIVRSGDNVNAVSLGVFSSKERAKRRYDEVVALKARLRKPKIEAIELPVKRYWVSWKLARDGQQEATNALLSSLGAEKSKEIACK